MELQDQIDVLRNENSQMRNQLEEVLERGQMAREKMIAATRASIVGSSQVQETQQDPDIEFENKQTDGQGCGDPPNIRFPPMNFMDETIEQLSIFQNKEIGQYRNIKLDNLKKD